MPEGGAGLFVGRQGDVLVGGLAGNLSPRRRLGGQAAGHQRLRPAHSAAGKRRAIRKRRAEHPAATLGKRGHRPADGYDRAVRRLPSRRCSSATPRATIGKAASNHSSASSRGKWRSAEDKCFWPSIDATCCATTHNSSRLTRFRRHLSGTVESAVVSPDGRYLAIVVAIARLWLYDIRESQPATLDLVGQGDVSAVAFDGPEDVCRRSADARHRVRS